MHTSQLNKNGRNGPPVTPKNLVPGLQAGDENSWQECYELYYQWLLGIALSRGLPWEAAEDCVAKTMIALAAHIETFVYDRVRGRFSGYLQKVLRNAITDYLRKTQRDPLMLVNPRSLRQTESQTATVERIPNPLQRGVVTQVFANELRRALHAALQVLQKQISAQDFAIFTAYNLQDLSGEEVAAQFGVRPGTVYSIHFRCIRKMRRIMRGYDGGQAFAE